MRKDKKFEDKEQFDINKVEFKPISVFYQTFLQNFFLHQHYYSEERKSPEEYLEWHENQSNDIIKRLTNQKRRTLREEEIAAIRKLYTFISPRISDDLFSSIKNRVHFVFIYSEAEYYFFKCLKHLMIKKSFTEKEAEKNTVNIIMQNSWNKIFNIFKNMYEIDHCISNDLIQELNNFKIIRNLFVHGRGTITHRFLEKFPNTDLNIGEVFVLNTDIISKYKNILIDIIPHFDEILLKKCPELEYLKKK